MPLRMEGFCFTIGDADFHTELRAESIKKVFDDQSAQTVSSAELARMASEKYELFHITIGETTKNATDIIPGRVLTVAKSEIQYLPEVIISVVQLVKGMDEKEVQSFCGLSGMIPNIYASGLSCMTTIDDVLINMLLESGRGEQCHGSCGMGINEADLRKNAGFAITLGQLKVYSADALFQELKRIRKEYSLCRLHELIPDCPVQNEYFELLNDEAVLYHFAEAVIHNLRYITVVDDTKGLFADYNTIIFEGAQGLRLDSEYEKNWPHVTASRTGLTNVLRILDAVNLRLDEVIYVTRSYVTKHGAGPLAYENSDLLGEQKIMDETNVHNRWQGSLRYSRWKDVDDFLEVILEDGRKCAYPVKRSLLITHLNETKNQMLFQSGDVNIMAFAENEVVQQEFEQIYLSGTRSAEDVID